MIVCTESIDVDCMTNGTYYHDQVHRLKNTQLRNKLFWDLFQYILTTNRIQVWNNLWKMEKGIKIIS